MGGTCHMSISGASSTQPCPSREDAAISTLSQLAAGDSAHALMLVSLTRDGGGWRRFVARIAT